ncbi:preprotein translocase subunit SecA [Litorisediminicola beolgyonensis]|uniref:Protein translocase subunit SecA n=1 Tax=Litorisediminicola beolgyonensis TaxID=1173614 RepID=A0ABW3ZKQ9_9RHOB
MLQPEGAALGAAPRVRFYPERRDRYPGWLDERGQAALGRLSRDARLFAAPATDRAGVAAVLRLGRRLAALDDAAFDAEIVETRARIRRAGPTTSALREGVALAREASARTLGLRQRSVQIRGALAMLDGRLIEMDTGEGKTITAGLAAAAAALAGTPTHVITVNNYLAERDADTLRPVYERLGLTLGVILEDMSPQDRRAAYLCDLTYGSNTEMAFDYLRDRITFGAEGPQALRQRLARVASGSRDLSEPVMRGLHFAIVDEADSVLVDEAKTPLIISKQTDAAEEAAWAGRALDLARSLEKGPHYALEADERRVRLKEAGRERLTELTEGEDGLWQSRIRREEVIQQALAALFVFKRGEHYLVADGKIEIVDEYTGRLQPDRSWSDGMHQLIEAKEEVEITPQNIAVARMTYQRLFRRYVKLAGMTGTAREVTNELWSVYGLKTSRIPPHKPSKLRYRVPRVHGSVEAKWRAVVAETRTEAARGRPVLIGTRSVSASQAVSAALSAAGFEHRVLNAETDHESAEIIAEAGQAGRITVATNMAGRGVDIALGEGVREAGGLHVILTERHDAGRIDRQLAGRAGRRGEPGTVGQHLSLADPLLDAISAPHLRVLSYLPLIGLGPRLKLFDRAQARAERIHARMRRDLVRQDRRLNSMLSFTGGLE